eukprot:4380308-Prymnesium_polylepis.2
MRGLGAGAGTSPRQLGARAAALSTSHGGRLRTPPSRVRRAAGWPVRVRRGLAAHKCGRSSGKCGAIASSFGAKREI